MNTKSIAEFVISTGIDQWPSGVQKKAKECIMDLIGTMFAGLKTKPACISRDFVLDIGSKKESTLFGSHRKVSCLFAAYANNIAASALDYDDGHPSSALHPGTVILPAAFALAERENSSGKAFLEAIVAGYEAAIKASMFLRNSPKHPELHGGGTGGAYGVAAACARLLKLDEKKTTQAIAIASQYAPVCAGFKVFISGPMTKESIGWGGMAGLTASLLAQMGFTGPATATIFDETDIGGNISGKIGEQFELLNVYFKIYPACRIIHSAIDCLLDLMKSHSVTYKDIVGIEVETHQTAALLNNPNPITIEQAQYSYPYLLAATIVDGDMGVTQMTDKRIKDPLIIKEAKKISIYHNSSLDKLYPGSYPNIIRIKTIKGKFFEARKDTPKGDPKKPVSEKELRSKFLRNASIFISENGAERLAEAIDHIEKLNSVKEITNLIDRYRRQEALK